VVRPVARPSQSRLSRFRTIDDLGAAEQTVRDPTSRAIGDKGGVSPTLTCLRFREMRARSLGFRR
jgi:hypothetical protein